MEWLNLSIPEMAAKIRNREVGVRELTEKFLDHIEMMDRNLNCYITLCRNEALQRAEYVQKAIDGGEIFSPLAGVPMALKDNICTKNIKTTCASKMLAEFIPPYNATVVEKLLEAGAVLLGKLNMDEFAMGSNSETSYFGPVKNPWNPEKSPGGSSGGAAAAVAAGEAFYALGSDTGGSVRIPASHCGVTGLKPSYGRVSRYGLISYASSMDQIGPLAGSVRECEMIFQVIQGKDTRDSTSVDFSDSMEDMPLDKLKIGIPQDFVDGNVEEEVKNAVLKAAGELENLGAKCEFFSMPLKDYIIPVYYIIASAEASSNLSRYDGIKYGFRVPESTDLQDLYIQSRSQGFGLEVKKRIMLGTFVLGSGNYEAYYQKAMKIRNLMVQSLASVFEEYDLILSPVTASTAPGLCESRRNYQKTLFVDMFTAPANLAGLPALAVPCGFSREGMPIGMQLVGKIFGESLLFKVGKAYQAVTDFHEKRPWLTAKIIQVSGNNKGIFLKGTGDNNAV